MNALTPTVRHAVQGLLAGLALSASLAQADQFVAYGDYEVHYNAFNSTFVEPQVAQSYGLTRSKTLALINVSVLQKASDGSKTPVTAIVKGSASNLIGQSSDISFKKIEETGALYYIGGLPFSNEQLMRIVLDVQPDPNQPAYSIQLEQTFYAE
ncbi:DUF4426 domain-containing protein [Marinobacterium sedimentorum]|uniref:DUF4426 domain-containing protein n=1 Tax=Marinobacterium sedimentorum TaxID=2927804 RepID=UPI0020C5F683|nr:DUF4426 domain-containing protein [Marinobacterium sedimentorum]MCP8686241.1 DUF4426 domain-containing protein [Marinobacterium sedimentorum]